jgi:hypothetical protein
MRPVIVLSLGAGVQSTTIALLAVDGVLPHVDHAVFADTGWEPAAVYDHLDRLAPVLADAGTQLHRVTMGDLRADALSSRYVPIPMHTVDAAGDPGIGRRQCTHQYKLRPIKAKVRELLGVAAGRRVPRGAYVDHWVGISADEAGRIRPSDVAYMRRRDPLVDLLPLPWTRTACRTYLADRWPWPVPRSACVGCPYHTNAEWRAIRDRDPAGWIDAVTFDADMRRQAADRGDTVTPYLHHDRVALADADIDTPDRPDPRPSLFDEPVGCSPYDCHGV